MSLRGVYGELTVSLRGAYGELKERLGVLLSVRQGFRLEVVA